MRTLRYATWLFLPLFAALAGCGASQSYQIGVRTYYPIIATRMDGLLADSPAAAGLRAAAVAPITYPVASQAWTNAAPIYRTLVAGAPALDKPAHRRSDWLGTATDMDAMNAAEAAHRNIFMHLFTPAPTPLPAPQP